MKKAPFIWLGAGRAKKRGVARRGRYLDEVARAGLPVPDGAILLDELFRIFLQEGVVEQAGDNVTVPDPIWLLEVLYRDVRFPHLQKTADISLIPADEFEGQLPPQAVAHNVDLEDADHLAATLSKVWSYAGANDELRHDVLLLQHMEGETAGRALSPHDRVEDEVTILSAVVEEEVLLPQLGKWQRPSQEYAPYARRLQMLLRGVRRTLSDEEAFDFYWQDDGEVCWIMRFN